MCGSRLASFILSAGAMSTEESERLARCWSSVRMGGVCLSDRGNLGGREKTRTNHSFEKIYMMQIKMRDDCFPGLDLVFWHFMQHKIVTIFEFHLLHY